MSEIKRVCVVGAGAIGSLLAGHIGALADVEMSVLVRRESHAADLNEHGLKVTGKSDLSASVLASTNPAYRQILLLALALRLKYIHNCYF